MNGYTKACERFISVVEGLPVGPETYTILGMFPYRVYVKKMISNGKTEIALSYENGDADGREKTVYFDDAKRMLMERTGDFHALTERDINTAIDMIYHR